MNLTYLTASDVIRLLEQGEVNSRQLLDHYYGRMDLVNEGLNAVVQQQRETAYAQADQADRDRKKAVGTGHCMVCRLRSRSHLMSAGCLQPLEPRI